VDGDYSLFRLENFGKMGDGAAQRPVSEYIALLELCRWIEGMQILPAGGLTLPGGALNHNQNQIIINPLESFYKLPTS